MNKSEWQEWRTNPITKQILTDIDNALNGVMRTSPIMPTADETAMKASYHEGFINGVAEFLVSIETMELNVEDDKNED